MPSAHVIGCEDGWQAFGDYCYWFSNADGNGDYASHDEAQKQCQDKGANLASIHSSDENDFVYSLLNCERCLPSDVFFISLETSMVKKT